jgi:hypothetical protein
MSDFIYSNITISYSGTDPNGYTTARGFVQSTTPILNKPSDYYLCVSRFSIDATTVPLIIPLIELGQSNPDLTSYQVCLSFNGVYSDPINIIYITGDPTQPIPYAPLTDIDLSSRYYYVYTYQAFLSMINSAFATALTNLNAKTATGEIIPPELYYDPAFGIVMKCKQSYGQNYNTIPLGGKIQISFGGNLSALFGHGFTTTQLNDNNTPCINTMILYGNGSSNVSGYWIQPIQGTAELSAWSEACTFQIITTLPIQFEYSGTAGTAYSTSLTGQSQQQIILTDFQVDSTVPTAYHSQLVYSQTNTLKMIDLLSNDPLYRYDITNVVYTDRYNRVFPLLVGPNQNINLKFSFVKKCVYSK